MKQLQSVAGRMEMAHEDFQRVCQVEITRLVEGQIGDTWLVHLLYEAVRCSRECCELAKAPLVGKALRDYVNEQAQVADANSKEWEAAGAGGKENAAYRAGMWYAYNDIRNRLPQ